MPAREFIVRVNRALSPEEQRKVAAAFARQRLNETLRKDHAVLGYVPKVHVDVDGRDGAALESVKLNGGHITFEFDIASDLTRNVISEALLALRAASPVVSGAYRDAHTLYINGAAVNTIPDTIKLNDVIMIANPLPYARRLDIGVTKSGRAFVVQVAPHIYRRVGNALASRFGNAARITVADSPGVLLPAAGAVQGVAGRSGISTHHQSGGRRVRRRLHKGEPLRSPALLIQMLG